MRLCRLLLLHVTLCSSAQRQVVTAKVANSRSCDFKTITQSLVRNSASVMTTTRRPWHACKHSFGPPSMRRKIGQEPSLGFLHKPHKVWLSCADVDRLKNKSVRGPAVGAAERKTQRLQAKHRVGERFRSSDARRQPARIEKDSRGSPSHRHKSSLGITTP